MKTSDLRGAGRLATDATIGLANLVENLHHNILRVPGVLGPASQQNTRGITGLVYRSIRGVTRLVGGSIDALLGQVQALVGPESGPDSGPDSRTGSGPGSGTSSSERDAVLAALNGVLGDHLAASSNPLATVMHLRSQGRPLVLSPEALAAALPQATGRVLVLVHGLCMHGGQWLRKGHDHGAALAASGGYTPVYLHYNSGRHVSDNGRELAGLLGALWQAWPVPVEHLTLIGHSMGGLVARSACHQAASAPTAPGWLHHLRHLACLGTPHHGAPLERGGRWVDVVLGASPYTAAFARLGQLRSAGITDLRHGSVLEADWAGAGRGHGTPAPLPVPLPAGVACFALAASLAAAAGGLQGALLGDGLVPVASALGQHADAQRCLAFEPAHQWVGYGLNHLDLLSSEAVSAQLVQWLAVGG